MAAMPILSYVELSGTLGMAARNGLLPMLRDGTNLDLSDGTLFAVPARLCNAMIRFFMPIVSFEHTGLNLQGARFLGIWMSTWLLMSVESMQGNRSDPSKRYIVIFGLLMEWVGVGSVLPAWALINLWYSRGSPATSENSDFIAHPDDVTASIWSLLIGAVLPTLFMYCCSSSSVNPIFSKQLWIVVRLFHPIVSFLVYSLLRRSSTAPQPSTAQIETARRKLHRMRLVAFWMAALAHLLSLMAAAYTRLQYTGSQDTEGQLTDWPRVVSPWRHWHEKVQSLEESVGIFLLWDEAVTSLAILLWALASRATGVKGQAGDAVGKALVLSTVGGPAAAAAAIVR